MLTFEQGRTFTLSLMITGLMVAACFSTAFAQEDDVDKNGDKLFYAELSQPMSFNPLYGMDDKISHRILTFLYNGLIKVNTDLEIVNDLAESYETEWLADGREAITVILKPDIFFHDRSPLTADDVKFTYDAIQNPQNPTPLKAYLDKLDRVEAIDERTVRFVFKGRFPSNIYTLIYPILPTHIFNDNTVIPMDAIMSQQDAMMMKKPVGTGPYSFMMNAGTTIMFNKNREYKPRPAYITDIYLMIRADQETMITEMETEAIDFLPNVPPFKVPRLRQNPSVDIHKYYTLNITSIIFNNENQFFEDARVRQAFDFIVDKQHIIEVVFNGMAKKISGPFPPISWANNPVIRPREKDLVQAKALFKEAGYYKSEVEEILKKGEVPFYITILYERGMNAHLEVLTIIQQDLEEMGVKVNIEALDKAILNKRVQYDHNFDMVIYDWEFDVDPDRFDLFHSSQSNPGGLNFGSYDNMDVDDLLREGRSSGNQDVRRRIYHDVHALIAEDVPHLFLYTQQYNAPVHYRILEANPNAISVFSNIDDWYCDPKMR
ncbi:MAG: ABC transporter substrate-binding protein [Candidatus Electryonea clarkiae]|nr:ABC transporter substrate-binding protein [Candidatus Electryonea clarkiae]